MYFDFYVDKILKKKKLPLKKKKSSPKVQYPDFILCLYYDLLSLIIKG